jgi:hypothetical protein
VTVSDSDLRSWIDYVFDHPVSDPAWHWAPEAARLTLTPTREAELYVETFERSEEMLQRFSSVQVDQGLDYLTSNMCSSHMFALLDPSVPEATRLRAVRSFVPLFETTMRRRCSERLSHLNEPGADPLNSSCYMWWDRLPFCPSPPHDEDSRLGGDQGLQARFDEETLRVMTRILGIPHDACRESALHGLGHWHLGYPDEVSSIIDRFLLSSPALREELRVYADAARRGMVL